MLLPRGPILHLPNWQGKNAGTLPSGSINLAFPGWVTVYSPYELKVLDTELAMKRPGHRRARWPSSLERL